MAAMLASRMTMALALDLVFGEPPERLHPVCWMGKAVSAAERQALDRRGDRSGGLEAGRERLAGAAVTLSLTAGAYLLTRELLNMLPARAAIIAETALLSTTLAVSSLYAAARAVEDGLSLGSVDSGKRQVARLVGRDTGDLDEGGVARAAVESVAENANDGIVAPLFYGFMGGAPLAMAYKMVNTLDSMVGYRDRRYRDFGWAAARLDDLAGLVPARLTGLAVVTVSPLVGASARDAIASWRSDASAHGSPNAGVCESAFAGALGIELGGTNSYGSRIVETPAMGRGGRRPEAGDIGRAARLMVAVAAVVYFGAAAAAWLAGRR